MVLTGVSSVERPSSTDVADSDSPVFTSTGKCRATMGRSDEMRRQATTSSAEGFLCFHLVGATTHVR